jgi:hypothetical protein
MPLTAKGEEILAQMKEQYGEEKGERVFYAAKNKGTITGVDAMKTRAKDVTQGRARDVTQGRARDDGLPGIPHSNAEEPLPSVEATPTRTPPAPSEKPGLNPPSGMAAPSTGLNMASPAIDRRGPRPPDVQIGKVADYAAAAGHRPPEKQA